MSAELFNTLGGYSVGIPPITVVDANGNITSNRAVIAYLTSNIIDVSGNVTASYFLGNVIGNVSGNFVVPGTNTSILFNEEGNAGASDAFQFDYSSNVLSLSGNIVVTRILTDNYLDSNGDPFTFQVSAAGSNQQIQYNNNGNLGADANFFYNSALELLAVSNISAQTIDVAEILTDLITVDGNAIANYFIGNLVGNISNANNVSANFLTGTLTTGAQPNITSIGNLATLTVLGNASFLNANTGNITSNNVVANLLTGSLVTSAQPNITSIGTLSNLTVSGNGIFGNVNGGNLVTANYLSGILTTATQANITTVGNLQNLNVVSNLAVGNNITSNRLTANTIVGVISTASQPNITSLGTLTTLNVSGNISASNFVGNFVGVISNANLANYASQIIDNNQPNITGVGTLGNLIVTGNANVGNNVYANRLISNLVTGILTTAAQPNITSLGTLTGLSVTGNVTAANFLGNFIGTVTNANSANFANSVVGNSQPNITSLGTLTNLSVTGNVSANNFIGNFSGNISNANFANTANYANLAAIANVAYLVSGSNVSGTVANANYALYAGQANTANSATVAASANSVAGANVTGVVSAANIANIANIAYSVSGANVSGTVANANYALNSGQANTANSATVAASANSVAGANVTGTVANATYAISAGSANTAGTVTTNAQPNITSVGTLSSLSVSGNTTVGNLITGGNISANYVSGILSTGNQPGITNVGTLGNLTVTGNITAANFIGNITGNISNANFASYAGNVTLAAQSNITTVGTLGNLSVSGNITTNNILVNANANVSSITATNTVQTVNLVGTGNTTLLRANITGNVNAGNVSGGNLVSANYLTGTLTTNSQPNINYLGNLGWLNVDTSIANSNGNITFNGSMSGTGSFSNINITGNLDAGNYISADELRGSLTTSSQPNITSLGNLTNLNVIGISNLGNVGNIKILGGTANYVLITDGTGNLNWAPQTGGGNGNGTPGGLTTQVQYNSNGTFAGDPNFTWNDATKVLIVGNNITVANTVSALRLVSSVATGTSPLLVTSTTPVANLAVETAATVRSANQPNITSLGNLTSLVVSGNANVGNLGVGGSFNLTGNFSAGNISTPGQTNTTGLTVSGNATFTNNTVISGSGLLRINGNVNAANAANVNLGNVSNLHIDGGINGYVLQTDGAGGLSWTAQTGGGGNGTPGGSNTQIQYNDTGAFGGSAFFTFNENTNTVTVAGNLIANSFQMGAGIYRFSYSNVFQAITNTGTANQVLWSVEADEISGVDFVIVSTDTSANVRQVSKIFAVVLGSDVNYNETNTIAVNGYNGDFSVQYDPGNIITPATVGLYFSPQSANTMTHKMQITTYDN